MGTATIAKSLERRGKTITTFVVYDALGAALATRFRPGSHPGGHGRAPVFPGAGVRVLARGYRPHLAGWARPFSRFAAAGMAKTGHISAQEKLCQLRSLDARIYVCGPSMQRFKVAPEQLIFEDLPQVWST